MMTKQSLLIPRVIGHRGAAAYVAENTLAGFRHAAELGCRWVEFDVRLSGDGHAVVFHDATLERTTNGSGRVSAMPLAELLTFDAGGEPIPTLELTLALLAALGMGCDLEMKAERGRESALAEAVAHTVARAAPIPILVESFSAPALAAFARHAPHLPRALALERLEPGWREAAADVGASALVCGHDALRREQVSATREAGLALVAYTVNDPARALDLLAWGIDAVISDAPDTILAALAK